jgi:hypothetical protein
MVVKSQLASIRAGAKPVTICRMRAKPFVGLPFVASVACFSVTNAFGACTILLTSTALKISPTLVRSSFTKEHDWGAIVQ